MIRSLLMAGAAVAALSLAACGQPAETPAENALEAATPDANPAATVPTAANEAAAPDFVAKAAASDMFEVEAGKLAAEKAVGAEVKAFARMMVEAHTKTTNDLKAAIAESGQAITPPAALPQDKLDALNDLKAKAGADFDRAYLETQVDAHQAALDLLTRYGNEGDVPAIKAFAAATAPAVQQHYDQAKALRDALK